MPYMYEKHGCKKEFQSRSGRAKHFKKCPLPYQNLKSYSKTEDGKIKCLKCNTILANFANYYRHKKNVHNTQPKKVKEKQLHVCTVCNKEFAKQSKLLRHIPGFPALNAACVRNFSHTNFGMINI